MKNSRKEQTLCAWCSEVVKKPIKYNGEFICAECFRNARKEMKKKGEKREV
jgi:hypothetical protein